MFSFYSVARQSIAQTKPRSAIVTYTVSRCHRQADNARIRPVRFLRISAAKIGPKRFDTSLQQGG